MIETHEFSILYLVLILIAFHMIIKGIMLLIPFDGKSYAASTILLSDTIKDTQVPEQKVENKEVTKTRKRGRPKKNKK